MVNGFTGLVVPGLRGGRRHLPVHPRWILDLQPDLAKATVTGGRMGARAGGLE
ncbi:MAG: hypothetical protein VKN13_07440 [Cyanobacteriota bacterium]|nr:hypothetical protein [Cyanobacteriota bacterium]